ncbi:xylose isomerase-like protein [Staphylotrichum tortipilum]|uniref:Apurinic-apyrimidinic endonuclease 1 n=1 Tax=Staphylotrichum tortipilum TaxID=2831512 RepID=A0AAN6RYL1_9PEZI|nr:xylose isomerase-like protein [Staphylotrichum longicolle]
MVPRPTRKAAQAKSTAIAMSKTSKPAKPTEPKRTPKRKAAPAEPESDFDDKDSGDDFDPAEDKENEAKKPAPKKRKTAAAKKDTGDDMALATRTAIPSLKRAMYIGAHVSAAGGVQNSIPNASNIGANAFALFLKSQRKWSSPPLADDAKTQFHALLKQHAYDAGKHVLPHGSYLVNLAQADAAKAAQAYDNFVDDLRRCDALGIALYNFHPGSSGGAPMPDACARIAAQLNRAHAATSSVVTVLENMCGSGNVVGGRFEHLRDIIALVDDKARVGVCLDTCHTFAAGYDMRTPEAFAATVAEFDAVVGLKYLRAFHLNDSKAPFASHRDLHANIGTGFLGLRAFHSVVNHEAFQGLPMVLETPIDEKGPDGKTVENKQVWADEIKLLESLIGMDPESAEFKEKEAELQMKGASERQKIQEQVDKKAEKDAAKGTKAKGKAKSKGKKKKKDEDSCDSCRESD